MKLEGLKALQAQLEELGSVGGQKVLARVARKAFVPVLEAAKAKAPVDTGLLREAIKLGVAKPKSGRAVVAVGLVITKGKHGKLRKHMTKAARKQSIATDPSARWHFVEKGTAKMPAKPFLRPALEENEARVVETFRDELDKAIKRALKRKARGGR